MSREEKILSRIRNGEISIDVQGRIWKHAIREYCPHCNEITRDRHIKTRRAEVKNKHGYLVVSVGDGCGDKIRAKAHRLVWIYFNGAIPDGLVINHKNGKKDDNRPDNLEVVTPSENMRHAINVLGSGGARHGESNHNSKLTESDVISIKERLDRGESPSSIADSFNVCRAAISRIRSGKNWAYLEGQEAVADA